MSRRTAELGTENSFAVLAEVNRRLSEGHRIVSFCIGEPDFATPASVRIAGIKAIADGRTGYTPAAGLPRLRELVAEHFSRTRGTPYSWEDVVIGCGSKPFIGYTILSVTDAGLDHEVLYPSPGYPIYESLIRAHGARPVPYQLRAHTGLAVDLDELRQKISGRTRLLILNSPHNPTGAVLGWSELESIAKVVEPWDDLWIYSDEVYSALIYDEPFRSIASIPSMTARTIVADTSSKTYAMTGWRVGYAANARLAAAFGRWNTNVDSCPPHVGQLAAIEAFSGAQDEVEARRRSYRERRDRIVDKLNQIPGFRCESPGGAFYAWPDVTGACRLVRASDGEELRRMLLEEAGVAVLSRYDFGVGFPGEGQHLRLCYAISPTDIDLGMKRIGDFVRRYL